MAAKTAGKIVINLTAGTSQFLIDMEKANASIGRFGNKMREVGTHGVSAVQATSGALRVMEGGLNNNLRAAERFAANVLNLGPMLQAAFPLIGGLAFLGLLGKMSDETKRFFTDMRNAPEKMAGAWRAMAAPLRVANDQMKVTNDRLELEIAKLEGKRQNTLALALDEARLAADKLADSLDKDLQKLHAFISENDAGTWKKILTGEPLGGGKGLDFGGDEIAKLIGGFTGSGGFNQEKNEIIDRNRQLLEKATTAKQKDAIATKTQTELLAAYDRVIKSTNTELQKRFNARTGGPLPADREDVAITGREGPEVERALAAVRQLQAERTSVVLDYRNQSDTSKRDKLQADASNAKTGRPIDNKLKELDEQIAAARLKLNAAGLSEAEKVIAKAEGEALKAIEEVNKALGRQNQNLKISPDDAAKIRARTTTLATTEAEEQWRTKLAQTTATIKDQTKTQEMLTAAIGRGYEAVKAASVETSVMAKVGAEQYNDRKWLSAHSDDVSRIRAGESAAYEAKHAESIANTSEQLRQQIALETRLAQVQILGEAAVRFATFQHNLELLKLKENSQALIDLETRRFQAEQATATSAAVAKIQDQIQATERLTAAQLDGAEAVRKAGLENKYAEIRKQGGDLMPGAAGIAGMTVQEANARAADEAAHVEQIAAKVSERVNAFKNELEILNQEEALLKLQIGSQVASVDQARALRDIEDARLKIMVQQDLAQRRAVDGMHAFFTEMREQAKSTAQSVYEALNSVFDRTADNLTKLMTGQKTDWAKMFKDTGRGLLKDAIKGSLKLGLGALGTVFPGLSGITDNLSDKLGGKKDGSSEAKALWVRLAGGGLKLGGGSGSSSNKGNGGLLGTGQVPTSKGSIDADGDVSDDGGGLAPGTPSGYKGGGPPPIPVMRNGKIVAWQQGDYQYSVGWWGAGLGGGTSSSNGAVVSSTISFPPMAEGGSVSAGHSYLVGEKGPEIFRAAASGSITSNAASRRLGGGGSTHNYSIDARGSDPIQVEKAVRTAILAAHSDAVTTSLHAVHDQQRRRPMGV